MLSIFLPCVAWPIKRVTRALRASEVALRLAVVAAGGTIAPERKRPMSNPVIAALQSQAAANISAEAAAVAFIQSVPQRITDAVAAAVGNGATAEELAPLTQLVADMKTSADAVTAALASPPTR